MFALNIKNLTTFTNNTTKFMPLNPKACTLGDPGIESTKISIACSTIKDPIQPKNRQQIQVPCSHKTNPHQLH